MHLPERSKPGPETYNAVKWALDMGSSVKFRKHVEVTCMGHQTCFIIVVIIIIMMMIIS